MSTLRRSNSVSHIPRLSRASDRQSNTARTPRSSSARPSSSRIFGSNLKHNAISTNFLSVPSGTLGRSGSYSNLTTPSHKTSMTPTLSASKNAKMNDKDYQKIQLQKVKSLFFELDPEMPALKPLTTRAYAHSMNLLFQIIDSRISITMENYKQAVSDYLTLFKYPYQLKPSVMKSPAVPSSWPFIFQIWIWLVEFVEQLTNSEMVIFHQAEHNLQLKLFQTILKHAADHFCFYNNPQMKVTSADGTVQEKSKYIVDIKEEIEILASIYEIDLTQLYETEDKEGYLDSQINSLKHSGDEIDAECSELVEKVNTKRKLNAQIIEKNIQHKSDLHNKLRQLYIKRKNIQMNMQESVERRDKLKSVISEQVCTKDDLISSKEKMRLLNHTVQLKQERIKTLKEQMSNLKLTEEKERLEKSVYQINNKIMPRAYRMPLLEDFKLPETNLNSPSFLKVAQDFAAKIKTLNAGLEEELEDMKVNLRQKEQEYKKDKMKIKALELEVEKKKKIEKELTVSHEARKKQFNEKVLEKILECENIEKELAAMISRTPNVDEVKLKLKASLLRQQGLYIMQKKTMTKAEDLFETAYNGIRTIMETQQEILQGINEAMVNKINFGFTSNK